jgi:hypothetical protein
VVDVMSRGELVTDGVMCEMVVMLRLCVRCHVPGVED